MIWIMLTPSALNEFRQVADWNRDAAPRDRVKRSEVVWCGGIENDRHIGTSSNYRADVWMRMPGV